MYLSTNQLLTEIMTRYEGELLAFLRQQLPTASDPEDVLQDVWLALSRTLEEQDITDPRAWLYRTTRNRITDLYRRRQRQAGIVPLQSDMDASWSANSYDQESDDEVWAEIMAAIDTLPASQREVFIRNALEGETLREIATDLGVPLKTVISRKGYARRRLQSLLADTYEDFFANE